MNPYNSSRYIHTIWSLQPGKKVVASTIACTYNKTTLVSTTTTSGCTDQISQMILQETSRNLDPENIVKDNFNYIWGFWLQCLEISRSVRRELILITARENNKKRHLCVVIHRIHSFEVKLLLFVSKFMTIKVVVIRNPRRKFFAHRKNANC